MTRRIRCILVDIAVVIIGVTAILVFLGLGLMAQDYARQQEQMEMRGP